jgi:pyridoxamine 5'-phosphate oxidase
MNGMSECIEFANKNKISFFATAEGNQPRVRALGLWFADATGFYFQIKDGGDLNRQLLANPRAEVCLYEHSNTMGKMLRVSGEVEFLDDRQLRERVLADRPFLRDFGHTADSSRLTIFRIAHGSAHFWTRESAMKPKELIEF